MGKREDPSGKGCPGGRGRRLRAPLASFSGCSGGEPLFPLRCGRASRCE